MRVGKYKLSESKLHLILTVVWGLLAIPTVLYWHSSILWVALISVYANVASHWSAYEASVAGENAAQTARDVKDALP